MAPKAIIRKGREGLGADGSDLFIKVKDGEFVDLCPAHSVEDIISFDQHAFWLDQGNSPIFPCLQSDDCPGCVLGNSPVMKAMMLVLVKGEDGLEEKIFGFGRSVFKQFIAIEEAMEGEVTGQIIRYSRTGSGKNSKYAVVPTGRTAKMPAELETNLIDHIGETDRDKIVDRLIEAGLWEVKRKAAPAPAPAPTAKPKGKKAKDDTPSETSWDSEDFSEPTGEIEE